MSEMQKKSDDEHCKDCCCARSWKALGITEYTGKSIPEHIQEMERRIKELTEALENLQNEWCNCVCERSPDHSEECTTARAVLAKAEGRA